MVRVVKRMIPYTEEEIEAMLPFVLRYRNIVDYINQSNKVVLHAKKDIQGGIRVWRDLIQYISDNSTSAEPPEEGVLLGVLYNKYRLYADKEPRIPTMPRFIWIEGNGVRVVMRLYNKKDYINILHKIIRAVVVKPHY